MASYWAKRRRALIRANETQNHIISQFESAVNIQASNVPTDEAPSEFTPETDEDYEGRPVDCAMIEEVSQSPESSGSSDWDEASCNSSEETSLPQKLQHWASAFSVPLVAVTALLAILRIHYPDLPKDARTLLKTQAKIAVERVGGGEYYHIGLEKGILSRLSSILLPEYLQTLKLQFNIDGLPIFKSSKLQFWPILGIVDCDYTKTFYCRPVLWVRKTEQCL